MTAAIIDLAMRKRVKVRARPTREDSRRKGKRFDKAAGFAKTRREIECHARHVGAAGTDDLSRWLVAWAWFNWRPKDPLWALITAAYRMGQKGLTEDEATLILEEASDAPRHMKADDLAAWLGCTYADRETLRLTRIGACDIGPQARAELRKRKARLRAQRRRHDKGAKPRADWEAEHSISRTRRHQPPDVVPTPPRRWHRSVRSRPLPYRCAHTCATSEEAIRERHPTD